MSLNTRLRSDKAVTPLALAFMLTFALIGGGIIPFMLWTEGLLKAKRGVEALAQEAALAAAAEVEVRELPDGREVLAIDESRIGPAATNYISVQRPVLRDMLGSRILRDGELEVSASCTSRTPSSEGGLCLGVSVEAQIGYLGTFLSNHLSPEIGVFGDGYAELAANAAKPTN